MFLKDLLEEQDKSPKGFIFSGKFPGWNVPELVHHAAGLESFRNAAGVLSGKPASPSIIQENIYISRILLYTNIRNRI